MYPLDEQYPFRPRTAAGVFDHRVERDDWETSRVRCVETRTSDGRRQGACGQPLPVPRRTRPELALHLLQGVPGGRMHEQLTDSAVRLRAIHTELEHQVSRQQTRWHYRIHRDRIRFEQQARAAHRRLKRSVLRFLRESSILNLLTAPLSYSLIVPLALMDAWITLYQHACFRIYGIPLVRRRDFLILDRHRLGYLNAIEKVSCVYCGYANGLFAYFREVAARTEQYWCPIKHARSVRDPHAHYPNFVDYGDAEGYHRRLPTLRRSWTPPKASKGSSRSRRRNR